MKNVIAIMLVMFLGLACEPETVVDDSFLAEAILSGGIVDIDNDNGVKIDGVENGVASPFWVIRENKLAVITCDWFGYPEICVQTGTKGRALGTTPTGDATEDNITTYREAGSEATPGDIGGGTWYSNVWYPFGSDTSANHRALRGAIASWGARWNNARVDFCTIGNPNGTHIHCVQD